MRDTGVHYLLHLREHILVRRELAVEAEELLLLLREFLWRAKVVSGCTDASTFRPDVRGRSGWEKGKGEGGRRK